MDIYQPPVNADFSSPEYRRFFQDVYNGIKCPLFEVEKNTDTTMAVGNTWYKMGYTTVIQDPLGGWDTTNYQWLPKVPGYYLFYANANVRWSSPPTLAGNFYLSIFRNAVVARSAVFGWTTGGTAFDGETYPCSVQTIKYMNGTTDYVDVRILKSNSESITVQGVSNAYFRPGFGGHKLTY